MDKEKNENSYHKININWYPGHIDKAKKQIIEDLKLVDIVIEIIDARIPISSRNPDIEEYTKNKRKLIVLNKCDLADEIQNEKWVNYFKSINISAIQVNSNSGEGINKVIKNIEEICKENKESYNNKGRIGKSIRAMVLGIPNVGKSSFINRLSKKNSAVVGNKPGVTRQKQWIKINQNIELLDTPGVLWPKFKDEKTALNLAYTGTIKDDIIDILDIGYNLLKFLIDNHLNKILIRYNINKEEIERIFKLDIEENEKIIEVMKLIGLKRGTLAIGGNVDIEKVAKIIVEDFRNGRIGKITLEEIK